MVYYDKISKLATLSSVELVNEILENTEDKSQEYNDRESISWKNSLPLLIKVISQSGLDELDLVIEYETPLNSRMDAILTYTELMTEIKLTNVDEATSIRSHPIAQTNTYRKHLEFNHSNMGEKQIDLIEVQYLHNYLDKQELFSKQYRIYQTRRDNCFVKGEEDKFIQLLKDTFDNRESHPITTLIVEGQYSMEKQGYENLYNIFLLDRMFENLPTSEELVVYRRFNPKKLPNIEIGQSLVDKGFVSTSLTENSLKKSVTFRYK